MSQFDIDDLVASLSASAHIGQEALDLKMLQTQLSQTLLSAFPMQINAPKGTGYAMSMNSHPHNTPTASTPVGWGAMSPRQRRSMNADMMMHDSPAQSEPEWEWSSDANAGAMTSSSSSSSSSTTQYYPTHNHFSPPTQSYHPSYNLEQQQLQASTFATTDPFFVAAQMQEQQHIQPQRSSAFFGHSQPMSLDSRGRLIAMREGAARFE
ncbi:hypothetical protein BOTBODRAFT_51091 [Botryobasidium botryosum FD-172 SS1]|uniref:Uncharacterized protein n=1 Tax=Botryobasidium botryosum (strain FD-172 SS1) TaxID=930990 RepID=A0A067MZA3_BOTB1|nr:hypothetical protein BOTBODRAFT_51091 [Botryobasidium botryosum FD-172 SS1]